MSFELRSLLRKNIAELVPYSSARDEFTGQANIFLDANENSFLTGDKGYNRYPDPYQKLLKGMIADVKQVATEHLFLGNGSDECIDLLYRAFCNPGKDNVVICPPTYGMYEVAARINDVEVRTAPLTSNFQLDKEKVLELVDEETKIIWICSPNNPTGNTLKREDVIDILNQFNGIVVLDEAYIDYSDVASFTRSLNDYPNLVVLQTFSKAWGLAGLRLGMAFASKELVDILNKIKPPYNINQATQELVMQALREKEKVTQSVEATLAGRAYLQQELQQLPMILKIFPSDANFLLIKMQGAKDIYQYLLKCGIVVRDRSNVLLCNDCLRITVGTEEENAALILSLNEYNASAPAVIKTVAAKNTTIDGWVNKRLVEHRRKTNETDITINLNLDGEGKAEISTGLRFFDHMLEQVGRHGKMDLSITALGDLDIDEHHTIEDTGIALGEAFAKVLVDKRGMERYGFALPMDDAEAKVLIDFGGRSWIVWDASFNREKIGDMPTEMFFHFFKSFSDAARCNLNIEAKGVNEHHKIEAIFKAFAKAIRMAVKRDPFSNYLPSTKGVL